MKIRMIALPVISRTISLWLAILMAPLLQAHPGKFDSNGGHLDRNTGVYHCHREDCILPNPSDQDNGKYEQNKDGHNIYVNPCNSPIPPGWCL